MEVTEVYTLATLLDPRFTKPGFSSQVKGEAATKLLGQKVDEIKHSITHESVADLQEGNWVSCMAIDDDEVEVVISANTLDSEIEDYLAVEKNIKKNSSPFIWWSANYEKYTNLGQLVKRRLSAQMGSVPCERKCKQAKRVVTAGRWNLEA